MRARTTFLAGLVAAAGVTAVSLEAEARTVIKNPNEHPDYRVELEPHGNVILWHRYYGYGRSLRGSRYDAFGSPEFGAGLRATIELGDPAFIPKLNNTVGITFGFDVTNCLYCREDFEIWTPIGLQWNFFLTDKWSVFADLGIAPRAHGFYRQVYFDFMTFIGGRYHFNDTVALTMRIGYPFTISVGASFFLGG
jgi:hypothetical protein